MITLKAPKLGGLVDKAKSAVKSSSLGRAVTAKKDEGLHGQLTGVIANVKFTQEIVEQNASHLTELAKTDQKAAKVLEVMQNQQFNASLDKVLNREAMSNEEAAEVVINLEEMTEALENLGTKFEIQVSGLVKQYSETINDDRLTDTTRNEYFESLITSLESQNLDESQSTELIKLRKIMEDDGGITNNNLVDINTSLKRLENSTTDVKLNQTLNDLNKTFDKSVMTTDELASTLTNNNLKEEFTTNASAVSMGAKDAGRGVLSWALGSMGLGGVDDLFGDMISDGIGNKVGDMWSNRKNGKKGGRARGKGGLISRAGGMVKGLFSGGKAAAMGAGALGLGGAGISALSAAAPAGVTAAAGGLASKAGGVTSKIGGIASKVGGAGMLKGAARLLGPAAMIGMGLYDGISGFNNAGETAGKSEEDLTLGDKLQSGVSGLLSGLSFGLIDSKDIYSGMDKVFDTTPDNDMSPEDKKTAERAKVRDVATNAVSTNDMSAKELQEHRAKLSSQGPDNVLDPKSIISFREELSSLDKAIAAKSVSEASNEGVSDKGDQVVDIVKKTVDTKPEKRKSGVSEQVKSLTDKPKSEEKSDTILGLPSALMNLIPGISAGSAIMSMLPGTSDSENGKGTGVINKVMDMIPNIGDSSSMLGTLSSAMMSLTPLGMLAKKLMKDESKVTGSSDSKITDVSTGASNVISPVDVAATKSSVVSVSDAPNKFAPTVEPQVIVQQAPSSSNSKNSGGSPPRRKLRPDDTNLLLLNQLILDR